MLPGSPVYAVWYDGKSAAPHRVQLFYRAYKNELRICPHTQINDVSCLAVWDLSAVKVMSGKLTRPEQGPVRLGLEADAGERLVLEDAQAVNPVAAWLREPLASRKKRTLKRWLIGTAIVWGICTGLYLGSNAIFGFLARAVPQSWEVSLGRASRDNVVEMLKWIPKAGVRGECETGSRAPELHALMERLGRGAPVGGYHFDLMVLDADFVNAFALPGGFLVVSSGLIQKCAGPDELAAVLAHEMAHVTERHGTGRLLRQYTWSGIVRMMGGTDSMTGNVALTLVTSSFDRDDERNADKLGVARLLGADINPAAMADFFGRLQKEEGADSSIYSYIASHPDLAERQANIRRAVARAAELPPAEQERTYTPAMGEAAWNHVRTLCGPGKKLPEKKAPAQDRQKEQPPAAPSGEQRHNAPAIPETGLESTACL